MVLKANKRSLQSYGNIFTPKPTFPTHQVSFDGKKINLADKGKTFIRSCLVFAKIKRFHRKSNFFGKILTSIPTQLPVTLHDLDILFRDVWLDDFLKAGHSR